MGMNSFISANSATIGQHCPVLPSPSPAPTYPNGKQRGKRCWSSQEDDGYEADSESGGPARKRLLLEDFLSTESVPLEKFLSGKHYSYEESFGERMERIEDEIERFDILLSEKASSPHLDGSSSRDSNSSCASPSEGAGTSISTGTGTLLGDPTRFKLVPHDLHYGMNRFLGESPKDGGPTPPAVRNEQEEEAMDRMGKENHWKELLANLITLNVIPVSTGANPLEGQVLGRV
ncbi:hypothetical protein HOY82DRAFT_294900 [Tuber indicum]|nr:hypothetical protein HOY82DRAFT_294900 [Tuber indicum]